MMTKNGDWSWDMYTYLYDHYFVEEPEKIAEHLGCSVTSVHKHAEKLLLTACPDTAEESYLAKSCGHALGDATVFLMPHRTLPYVKELISCASG